MKGYIYCFTNKENGKKYIGQTTNLVKRKNQHLNNDVITFDKIYTKHNKDMFKFEILEEVDKEKLNEKEIEWIKYYNTFNGPGYNNSPGGQSLRGENSYLTVISSKEMGREIYELYKNEEIPLKDIIEEYNISKSTIYRITSGVHWSTNNLEKYNRRVSTELALEIYQYCKKNPDFSYEEVSENFDIKEGSIYKIINAKREDLKSLEPLDYKYEHPKGEEHPSTITDKDVCLSIYNEYKEENFKNQQESSKFKKFLSNKYNEPLYKIERIIYSKHWSTKNLEPIKRFNWSKQKSLNIYDDYKSGMFTQKELVEKYNVSEDSVSRITRGKHKHTKHLPSIDLEVSFPRVKNPNSKITKEMGKEIYNKFKTEKITKKELAKKYALCTATIRMIVYGKHWTTKDEKSLRRKKKPVIGADVTKELALIIYYTCKFKNSDKKTLSLKFNISLTTVNAITNARHKYTNKLIPLNNKLSQKIVLKIFNVYMNKDYTQKELAKKYGISESTVYRIIHFEQKYTRELKKYF